MKKIFLMLSLCFLVAPVGAASSGDKPTFIDLVRHRWGQIWNGGTNDLYLTGYAWHNRYTYTPDKLNKKNYNEFAAGGGFGKGFIDEDGDWHALYAMGFSDSHRDFEPLVGYGFLKMFYLPKTIQAGAGFTWFATARKDIFHGIPFIGIPLPMVSLGTKKVNIYATYVPGKTNIGNVFFIFGKITFG
jgi:lipid IVA palmitoyltransferase